MQDQEENFFEKTSDLIREYTENRILLLKIQITKKTARVFSKLVFAIAAAMLLFLILLFVSMMAGYYFADLTGSLYKGFSIVAVLYLIVLFLFCILFKTYFSGKIMNAVTKVFFEKEPFNPDEE